MNPTSTQTPQFEKKSKLYKGRHYHGLCPAGKKIPEYISWRNMWNRCMNPNYRQWHLYGQRGIRVCDRWADFGNFYADMGPRPTPKHQIDRYPNQNGNYEPSNCRWATHDEQANNRRTCRVVEINGERKNVTQWCKVYGISLPTVGNRLHHGWDEVRAITTPSASKKKLTVSN